MSIQETFKVLETASPNKKNSLAQILLGWLSIKIVKLIAIREKHCHQRRGLFSLMSLWDNFENRIIPPPNFDCVIFRSVRRKSSDANYFHISLTIEWICELAHDGILYTLVPALRLNGLSNHDHVTQSTSKFLRLLIWNSLCMLSISVDVHGAFICTLLPTLWFYSPT